MGFKTMVANIIASFFLVIQRTFLLIIYPYKAMRRISTEEDTMQIYIIFALIFCYFQIANHFREYPYEPFVLFIMTVFNYGATVLFFFSVTHFLYKEKQVPFRPFLFTFAYTLLPTLIWFGVNSTLYALLPPPRNFTTEGTAFSIVFVSFSVAVLMWKITLEYLAIRFASRFPFFRITYAFLLYLVAVVPYSLMLYAFKFFRIPFL